MYYSVKGKDYKNFSELMSDIQLGYGSGWDTHFFEFKGGDKEFDLLDSSARPYISKYWRAIEKGEYKPDGNVQEHTFWEHYALQLGTYIYCNGFPNQKKEKEEYVEYMCTWIKKHYQGKLVDNSKKQKSKFNNYIKLWKEFENRYQQYESKARPS